MNAPARFPIDVPPRLDWHLLNWRDFMRSDACLRLRAPGRSSGFVGGGYNNDFDSMCIEADRHAAEAMDALIMGLSPVQSAAVHHRYLNAVYRFPRTNLDEVFQAACAVLVAGMSARGLV